MAMAAPDIKAAMQMAVKIINIFLIPTSLEAMGALCHG
jgi:hypothetical protein